MLPEPSLGWNAQAEVRHLTALASLRSRRMCSAPTTDIPDILDVPFLQELQGYWGFCHSHMRTFMSSTLDWLATGQWLKFSRYRGAILDLRMDGNDSYPGGASIGGSVRSAIQDGEALESFMPYLPLQPGPSEHVNDIDAWCQRLYSNSIPQAADADAVHRHIKSAESNIRSYDDLDRLAVTGRYVFGIGMDWTTGCDALQDIEFCDTLPYGSVRGGHALAVFGWKTRAGERWHILHNSQTDRWGKRRRIAMSPRWWDYVLGRSQYGAFGASDIATDDENPASRDLSFAASYIQI